MSVAFLLVIRFFKLNSQVISYAEAIEEYASAARKLLQVTGERQYGKQIKIGIREFTRRVLEDKLLNERITPIVSARDSNAGDTWFELSYRNFTKHIY